MNGTKTCNDAVIILKAFSDMQSGPQVNSDGIMLQHL